MQTKCGKDSSNADYFFFPVDYENENCWLEADAIWPVTAVSCSVSVEYSDL